MVLAESLVITHLVPFVPLGGSKECKMIIGAASFNESKCEGNKIPLKSLKIQWENAQPGIHQEQNPVICTQQAHQVRNCATKAVLIVRVVSLSGAKMHRSESQAIFLKLESKSGYTFATSSSMLHTKVPIFSGS